MNNIGPINLIPQGLISTSYKMKMVYSRIFKLPFKIPSNESRNVYIAFKGSHACINVAFFILSLQNQQMSCYTV